MAGAEEPEVGIELKEWAMDEAPVGITISDPDRDDNPIIYANEAFERITGYSREEVLGRNCRFLQGEGSDPETVATIREAVDEGESVSVELVNYRRNGEPFWNELTIAPLVDENGRVTNFVGFQDDVSARKEAELAVERERRNLNHILARIRGLLSDLTRVLVEAESRAEIEQGVVERVVETEPYAFAWIGESDGKTVVPRAWASESDLGIGTDTDTDIADFAVDLDGSDHPVARAVETGQIEVDALDGDGRGRPRVDLSGLDGVAAIPLIYGELSYGVLTIYAARPDAFDEREVTVLEALGRAIATALNALESRRILSTDDLVELEFEVDDPGLFLVELSARCECRLDYEGSVSGADSGLSMFFSTNAAPDDILDHAAEVPEIKHATLVSSGAEGRLLEFHMAADSFVSELARRGVRTRSVVAEAGTARIRIELPAEADHRRVTEQFRERYPETELVAYREHERPPITRAEFIEELERKLTERQRTALQKAYLGGYYDSTRRITGDELADSMDISRSTFHQHLQAAERKLISEFLDR